MLIYHQFMKLAQWHPRLVDELFEDEEYWLPVIEEAARVATSSWAGIQERTNQPLTY